LIGKSHVDKIGFWCNLDSLAEVSSALYTAFPRNFVASMNSRSKETPCNILTFFGTRRVFQCMGNLAGPKRNSDAPEKRRMKAARLLKSRPTLASAFWKQAKLL